MKKKQHLITIRGSKGKGGGGSTFEADDNMFARQSAAFIDAIAEGPIKGLVYGDASILVDEVRLRNVNQSTGRVSSATNFNNFTVITKNGDAQQVVDADFFAEYPSAAYTQDVGSAELLENEPQYFTISSGTFEKRETDYIKITVSTTGMSAITKKGDNKGDINTTTVYFTIDFNWVDNSGVHHTRQMFDTGFNGKVSGKYAHTFGFNIETIKANHTINDWSVKVNKLSSSPDSTDSVEVQNAIYVDSIEAAICDKLEYPYTAYVGGVIDAEAFNSVPQRGYEIDGKLIQIPSNHYPIDYNGRKLVLSDASDFAVGDVISQTLTASAITASGNAEEGYTATATVPAHGVAIGETFKATIATSTSTDEDFWEGTFVCTSTTTTQFTYVLNKPFDETTGAYKTLSSTTCGGTKTCAMFSGGLVDKKVSNTLYVRNVAAETSAVTGTITNGDGDSGTVTSSTQVLIPANYRRNVSTEKPATAEQDWDGTFYQSWCNNPAWVYNDLITNKIYGLGNYLSQEQVNKWELFQIGRYCDELVPAGVAAADLLSIHCTDDAAYIPNGASGQHEPRFSANVVIAGKNEAFKVLNDVTSIFRGMTYWLNGESYIVQDSEKDPVYQFTNANVIGGEFKYEGTSNKTRTNSIIVNWNNPQDYYRSRAEIVELEENLQKDDEFIKPEETTAFGCTSRGQARRLGKWKLLTNNWNTNTVSFSTSLNAAFLRPGDIVQVIDKNKEGKSWGGRVSTSSGTTAINVDRKPTSFSATGVETGYAEADYRLSISYVGYKAILAQDTATIGSTAYVRGAHLTSIATEEAAATLQDDSGNLVYVQWTPFTFTETQTLDAVSNDGKTLTVASAFNAAPSQDAIWVLSRAALSTGKTKKEAKLFRVMAIAENSVNEFEITGLEYNASKFDAVDKNEALTQDRTIYLPDSFKTVPAVENIRAIPHIRAGNGDDGNYNVLTVEWDPAMSTDDAGVKTPYNSVRHYQIEFSKDNTKWFGAGTTPNTDLDLDGNNIISGTYYFRIYTTSLNGVRSIVAESGAITVNFNKAVAPSEGSVGNTSDYAISKIGNISGSFSLNDSTGKVSFSPGNFQHNDGKNQHDVTGQGQLDFSGLTGSNSDNNGANTGYIYFDKSAEKFKAIAHDEVSDQFYTVGSSVFATATGTLTSSLTNQPTKWTGLDSTAFTTELAVGNVFKYTKSSTDYYHRVTEIVSNSVLYTKNPTRNTLVNSTNQAFSKPNFLANFLSASADTIMGQVVKDGSNNYTLQRYGTSQGEAGYSVFGTNESHTFAADNTGAISNSDYSAYTNDFTVKKGDQALTYAASGTAQNTFGISLTAKTGFSNNADINISGSGQITIDDNSLDSVSSATATLRITDLGTGSTITDRVLSFSKAQSGAGPITIQLLPSNHVIPYNEAGAESSSITFTTTVQNSSELSGTAYYDFDVDTNNNGTFTDKQNSTTSTFTLADGDEPASGSLVVVKVQLRDGATDGTVKATDIVTIYGVKEGSDAYTVINTNQAHALPTTNTGTITYTGSGTDIRVFKGSSMLEPVASGTPATGEFLVTPSASNITVGSASLVDTNSSGTNDTRRFGVHSSMSAAVAEIEYAVNCENVQTVTSAQTFSKSTEGADGATGRKAAELTIYYALDFTSTNSFTAPSTPSTGTYNFSNATVSSLPTGWTQAKPEVGPGKWVYQSEALVTESSTDNTSNAITWGTPSRADLPFGDINWVFKRASSQPTSVGTTNWPAVPTNWYDDIANVPSGSDEIWASKGVTAFVNSSGTFTYVTTWQDGVQIEGSTGATGAEGKGTTTVYYLQTGYTKPSTPSSGTDETPGSWITTLPTAASGKTIWFSLGTKPAGSSTWTFTSPQVYLGDFDYTIPGIFDNEWSLDLAGSGLAKLGLSAGDYANSSIGANDLYGSGKVWAALPASGANNYSLPSDVLKGTISVSGQTVTIPKADGSSYTITTQDTNTTYADLNALDSTAYSKLNGIEAGATADQAASEFNITSLAGYSAAAYANASVIATATVDGANTVTWSKYATGNYNPNSTTHTWSVTWKDGAGTTQATSTVVANLDTGNTDLNAPTITANATGSGVTSSVSGTGTTSQTITLSRSGFNNVVLKAVIYVVTGFSFKFNGE